MDNQIKDRAYALWEAAGRPEGRDEHFWFAATAELAQAAKPAKKARAPRAKKAA